MHILQYYHLIIRHLICGISPSIRPKMTSLGYRLVRTSLPVASLFVHFCTPPFETTHPTREHKAKEHNDKTKCQTGIQRRAQCHGILGPPCCSSSSNNII